MYGYVYDATYGLVIIGMIISIAANQFISSTYRKYSQVMNAGGVTGAAFAREMLQEAGLYEVSVTRVPGQLTDHYDPRSQQVFLSEAVYMNRSVAALGVAAHECGHALQDAEDYKPMRLRARLVPVAQFGAQSALPLILMGLLLSLTGLISLGILAFSASLLFQIVTLPVEFDASRRALQFMRTHQAISDEEVAMVRRVLTAAAFTYIAATLVTALQLLRLWLLFGKREDQ